MMILFFRSDLEEDGNYCLKYFEIQIFEKLMLLLYFSKHTNLQLEKADKKTIKIMKDLSKLFLFIILNFKLIILLLSIANGATP